MKKLIILKKYFYYILFIGVVIGGLSTLRIFTTKVQKEDNSSDYIEITINGAVRSEGKIVVQKNRKLREILHKVQILPIADFSKVNFDKIPRPGEIITIPFKKTAKIRASDIKNINQIMQMGIKKNQAQKIFDYFSKNRKWQWSEIENIHGVGKGSLELLKKNILLNTA
ncbi:MAG0490 family ComEA-like DNA-binding protein [[Mycoplasma] gypis]|uniref:Competence protein ComEA n=1 Tax=[Mycoplasma] gypis TaxID=92404 RepID=A0ABZ2RMW4_9BACT|nr:hypothetical protein [[Mycoplasma] gypis]MBN0919211.1 hypothetical protein [[Mycoplasma] gypis]